MADTASRPLVAGRVTLGHADAGSGEAVITVVDAHSRQQGRTRTVGGHYRLDLPGAGSWQLVASAPGHAPQADRVLVETGTREVSYDLVLVAASPGTGSDASEALPPAVHRA